MCRHEPWDGGKGSYCLMDTDLLFGMMRKCWRWIVVIVAQHCMYLMLLNCTLKNGWHRDLPGGAVDKSLGRFHVPRTTKPVLWGITGSASLTTQGLSDLFSSHAVLFLPDEFTISNSSGHFQTFCCKCQKGKVWEIIIGIFFFNWQTIALQCCVGFCHTTWIDCKYTYVPSCLSFQN